MNRTAKRLDRIAKAHGATTPAALAAICGVSTVTLWRWIAGRSRPSALADARLTQLEADAPADGEGAASGRRAGGAREAAAELARTSDSSRGPVRRGKSPEGAHSAEPSALPATSTED